MPNLSISEITTTHKLHLGNYTGDRGNFAFDSKPSAEAVIAVAHALLQEFKKVGIECVGCIEIRTPLTKASLTQPDVRDVVDGDVASVTLIGDPIARVLLPLPDPVKDIYAMAKIFIGQLYTNAQNTDDASVLILVQPRNPDDLGRLMHNTNSVVEALKNPVQALG